MSSSTPSMIANAAIVLEISSWTQVSKLASGMPVYSAVATMVLAGESTGVVKISDDGTFITITAPLGTPVQLTFTAAVAAGAKISNGATSFMVSAPYYKYPAEPVGSASWSQFATVLINHAQSFSEPALTWAYENTTWTLAAIPTGGTAVIDLNNVSDSQAYAFGFMLQDNTGGIGTWDPDVENDPTDPV